MKPSNLFLFLVPSLIWGSTWYAIKFQIGSTDPILSVGYRFILAAGIMLIYAGIARRSLRFKLRDHLFMALQGGCLFGLNYWLVYLAEEHLTSGLVAVIFAGLIFMNVFLGALFLGAPVRKNVLLGGVVGMIGIVLIFKNELSVFSLSDKNFLAFVFALGSMVLASCGNILSARNQRNKIPVIQTNAFGMLYGAVIVLCIAYFSGKQFTLETSPSYLISLLYLAVFGSVVAFSAYLSLLGKIGPDKAGYISLVMPVIALLISTVMEGYQWTIHGFLGLLLILGGILIALQKKNPNVKINR